MNKEISQFLADAMTAAGLVSHGKQCKALGERLSKDCMNLRNNLALPAQEPSVPECPYSCGWENLHKTAVNDGAYLAKYLESGHPLTDSQRATAIVASTRLIAVCRAMLEAAQIQLKKESE